MGFTKWFKKNFQATIWEVIVAIALVITFFVLRFLIHEYSTIFIILGFIVGTWLAFRPSEWAVEGLNSGAKYVGLSEYIAGLLSSLASNLPEAVIAILLIISGEIEIAVITILAAAGFNTIILGLSILIATIRKGSIDVPEDLEKKESAIIRWGIVALSMTVIYGLVEFTQVSNWAQTEIARPIAALLALSYIMYLVYVIFVKEPLKNTVTDALDEDEIPEEEKSEVHKKEEEHDISKPHLSITMTIILLILGFVGIFGAGETLTFSVEALIEEATMPKEFVALILGAAGAVPEHGIALLSAAREDVEVAIGNALGGILQSSLLIFGILGMIVTISFSPFMILQLAAIAGVLWFVKRCIHDRKFDWFEGTMIILLQILIFLILIFDVLLTS
ncbi:MAG: sodium:calcium antiporter [Candidatus Thorarchaeota archaeon]